MEPGEHPAHHLSRRSALSAAGVLGGLAAVALAVLVVVGPASAHAAKIEHRTGEAVEVIAEYDNGAPMSGAQVLVYAPGEDEPRLTGEADEEGRFVFMPPEAGEWDVQVWQGGHGDIVRVEAGEGAEPAAASTEYSPLQVGLMAAMGIWGFVGTALFFARRRR